MTLQELQSTPKFFELFSDQRFVNLLNYLREHPGPLEENVPNDASAIIRSEGSWQGWFRVMKRIGEVGRPTSDPKSPISGLKYQPTQPEPKKP